MERIYERAYNLVEGYRELAMGIDMPQEFSLKHYFDEVRMEKRKCVFSGVVRSEGREKNSENKASKKLDMVQMAAQRLVYRYFLYLKEEGHNLSIPLACKPWLSLKDDVTSMYPPSMHSLSKWEIENCPWWIDMDGVELLEREQEKHVQYGKTFVKSGDKDNDHGKNVEQGPSHNVSRGKRKTQESDQEDDDDIQDITTQGGDKQNVKIIKRVNTFVYIEEDLVTIGSTTRDHKCIALVGDYIEIGKDFACGKKNASYTIVHEHFMKYRNTNIEYYRGGKSVGWAVDLVFLDFPFGGVLHGSISRPPWDVLTEEHIRYGLSVAAASLADNSWLLIMASHEGNAIGWIERYARVSDLEIWHRIFVLHHSSYGSLSLGTYEIECNASLLFMVRRRGFEPRIYLENSKYLFQSLHMEPLSSFVTHHFPTTEISRRSDGVEWRGSLQKSHTFLACFLEMLCESGGMALELGCGTSPLAKVCLLSGRICASMDYDNSIISSYVLPFLEAKRKTVREEASSSHIGDDDVDVLAGISPYD